jgi:hypothetical protein
MKGLFRVQTYSGRGGVQCDHICSSGMKTKQDIVIFRGICTAKLITC